MTAEHKLPPDTDSGVQRISLRTALVAAAVLLVAIGFLLRLTAPKPVPVLTTPDPGTPVDTLVVAPSTLEGRISMSGLVQPRRRVELFAEQAGRVLEVGAEKLDRVTTGQLLLRIDPLPGEVEVARAEATLAQARSDLNLADAELARSQKLATSQISSASDLDRRQNAHQVALAVKRAAQASVRAARDRLSQRELFAPFDGVLREFDCEVGEYVSPGQPIGELLDVSRVRVHIGLRDRDVVAVQPEMQAKVRVDARDGEVRSGTVLRVAAAAESATRKFPVQVEVENADGLLMPGMLARVELELGNQSQAILVPREAVLSDFGLPFVYVVHAEPGTPSIVRRRRVTVQEVPFHPGSMAVTQGLSSGERIAVTSLRQLRDGSQVAPKTLHGSRSKAQLESGGPVP
ncbi:MAG: efflux RND transporter periplasmic adaptor subunit [Myxococcota bacterium]|nr:efflux RND transporter periplasmic adaptor subunit [Myxococcota bacterium]